jgi:hypothetical protein
MTSNDTDFGSESILASEIGVSCDAFDTPSQGLSLIE